jgi:hypothetical protein
MLNLDIKNIRWNIFEYFRMVNIKKSKLINSQIQAQNLQLQNVLLMVSNKMV